ncbi:MAG: hypothetical protein KJ645_07990 [Planctomycetes bacterium]|nr:hypothetical protein [Planctomycetota bacterium]
MTPYRHTQIGNLILVVTGIPVIVLLLVILSAEANIVVITTMGILLACMVLFCSLTVDVNEESILIRFGPGFIRKRFDLNEVLGVKTVRNRWYYGWGIRMLSNGWLYNVSGLDAVELEMADGRQHRIGTDYPEDLENAIRKALDSMPRS